jgi:restriction system protein
MPREYIKVDISPAEFEMQVKSWIEKSGAGLLDFRVEHLSTLEGDSGDYEIDVTATFKVFENAEIKVLIECKRYSSPVKRDVIVILAGKIRDSNAHKGMVFSTSGFQKGAVEYAQNRGIATIGFQEGHTNYFTKSLDVQPATPPPWVRIPKYIGWYTTSSGPDKTNYSLIEDERLDEILNYFRKPT